MPQFGGDFAATSPYFDRVEKLLGSGLAEGVEQKVKISAGLTNRVVGLIDAEAKRSGISFADQLRRITDAWADTITNAHQQPRERVVVLDRASGQLLRTV